MRILRAWRAAGTATGLALALGAAAPQASAQLQVVPFGGVEFDTEDMTLFLLGVSVQPGTPGLQPVAGLLGYHLTFPAGAETQSILAVSPSAGLRYQWAMGAVQATVGYLWVDSDEEVAAPVFGAPGGAESGLTTSAMADYWGTGFRTAQLLGTYNWGDQYFWTRGRAAQQVAALGGFPVRLGAEVVAQGGGDNVFADDYQAFQFGPFVQFTVVPGLELTGVIGAKTDNLDDPERSELFPYFKLEFVYVPGQGGF